MIQLFSFLSAFFVSLVLTPFIKSISFKLGFLDKPGHRKIHSKPIPLMGGLSVFLSFAIALFIFGNRNHELLSILVFGLIFVLFGSIDDRGIQIRARYKIWSHLLFSFLFLYFSGLHVNFFNNQLINIILSACFITFMTNSMNMLDGMDGLVSGVSFFAAGFFAMIAINSGQMDLVVLSLSLMGALLGFLKYNFNPASIFLGEAGSTFLGFMMALFAIKINIYSLWNIALLFGIERLQIISFIVPLIIIGIPIFDTYFVFTNRFLHRVKFSQPGKDHSHHRIHLMGFSQKATVLSIYAIQFVLGLLALAMVRADIQQFFSIMAIVAVFFVVFTVFLLQVKVYE